jgi:hypothetical protein
MNSRLSPSDSLPIDVEAAWRPLGCRDSTGSYRMAYKKSLDVLGSVGIAGSSPLEGPHTCGTARPHTPSGIGKTLACVSSVRRLALVFAIPWYRS